MRLPQVLNIFHFHFSLLIESFNVRLNNVFYIAFLGGGLGEPLFGHQRAVPPEIPVLF